MSGWLMGLPARILDLSEQLNNSVIPEIAKTPWKVTALPAPQVVGPGGTTYGYGAQVNGAADTTLQTLVSVTGGGFLRFAELNTGSTTAVASLKMLVTVDGIDLVDHTEASLAAFYSIVGVGRKVGSTSTDVFEWEIPFRSSLVIKAQQGTARTMWLRYTVILAAPYTA